MMEMILMRVTVFTTEGTRFFDRAEDVFTDGEDDLTIVAPGQRERVIPKGEWLGYTVARI